MGKTKICKYCKSEMDKKATHCPHCTKKQPPQPAAIFAIIFFVIVAIFILCIAMADDGTSMTEQLEGSVDEVTITMDEYNQIDYGMSVDEVVSIVGGEGTIQSESELEGIKTVIYVWYGVKPGSDALITFSNGEVFAKAQVNLE